MTSTVPQQITINAQVNFGLSFFANTNLLNYAEPDTTTAQISASAMVKITHSTTNNTINLATLFPAVTTALAYIVQDMTNPGVSVAIGMASSGSRFTLAPSGFFMIRTNGSSPTLYVDGTDASNDALLQISCIAN